MCERFTKDCDRVVTTLQSALAGVPDSSTEPGVLTREIVPVPSTALSGIIRRVSGFCGFETE